MQKQIEKIIEEWKGLKLPQMYIFVNGIPALNPEYLNEQNKWIEEKLNSAYQSGREDERERIIKLVKSNSKGSFTDEGGNDCWYIDDLVKNLSTLTNNKDE
jgi:hypothetical protein